MADQESVPMVVRESGTVRFAQPPADWVAEQAPRGGLPLYLALLRSRIWIIALTVGITVGTTALVVGTRHKTYQARADLLATALPRENVNLFGFGLVSESGDPTRDTETVAQLITIPSVAERVRRTLGLRESAQALLRDVAAQPIAQSGIISITAKASHPDLAARLANAFGEAAIAERTIRLHGALDTVIPRLRRQLSELPPAEGAARATLSSRIQDLETLRVMNDPTLHVETRAVPPNGPTSPRVALSLVAAVVAGLVLGFGGVLAAHFFDARILLEEELRRYRIPILGRIPVDYGRTRRRERSALTPDQLAGATEEAFRRLASSFTARANSSQKHTIFVTGAAPSDGKTTTSVNLAASLGRMNERVILVEVDSRKPQLGRILGLTASQGVASVAEGAPLSDALEQSDRLPPDVHVLAQESEAASAPPFVTAEAADALVGESELLADWVIFDGPALNYALDTLAIAKRADSVVLVVRLGKTRQRDLSELSELLIQQAIIPDGFVVFGGSPRPAYS